MPDQIIIDAAAKLLQDLCPAAVINAAEAGTWPQELWDGLQDAGLTLAWVPDTLGGAGADLLEDPDHQRLAG